MQEVEAIHNSPEIQVSSPEKRKGDMGHGKDVSVAFWTIALGMYLRHTLRPPRLHAVSLVNMYLSQGVVYAIVAPVCGHKQDGPIRITF